jgi:hypothetical protein
MIIRKFTWILFAALVAIGIASCKKDPNLKASKSECDDACTHIVALNGGKKDAFSKRCSKICVDKEWTVGDTKCMSEAKTTNEAKDCGAAAKALMDLKEKAARRGQKRGRGRGRGRPRPGDQQPADPAKAGGAATGAAPTGAPAATDPAKPTDNEP